MSSLHRRSYFVPTLLVLGFLFLYVPILSMIFFSFNNSRLFTVWDAQKPEDKEKAPIIYTTPEYVDYCFAAHERLGKDTIEKIRKALIALDPKNPDHKEVLDAWSAKAFVAADPKMWDGMKKVLVELPKDFLK